jgi:hypothetical protein
VSALDTVYEYAGYKLAGMLHDVFGGVGLPLIVALAGAAWTVHTLSERGSPKDLAAYFLYLILAVWLASPTSVRDVAAPRFPAYLGEATDLLQKRAAGRIQERFLANPFEWERIASMVSLGRILDPGLQRDVAVFLDRCAKPALAGAEPQGPNVFRPGALGYPPSCEERREALWKRLRHHVRDDPYHRATLEAARRRDPGTAEAFEERYLDEIARKALDDPWSPTGELSLVRASLGGDSAFEAITVAADSPVRAAPGGRWAIPSAGSFASQGVQAVYEAAVSGVARIGQWWDNEISSRQRYYLVTVYGPHVYGLSLLLILGLFPAAGLFALWPGKWRALVNYAKIFIAVKLWPVGWAALSSFNATRSVLEAFDPVERTGGDVFLAIASMYLLVPAFSFLIVHLGASALAAPFTPAVPPPSGPTLGPAAPVVNVAVRAAR